MDAVDGDLNANIQSSSNLNADVRTYSVTYDVSDAGNKAAQVVRTVVVLDMLPVVRSRG